MTLGHSSLGQGALWHTGSSVVPVVPACGPRTTLTVFSSFQTLPFSEGVGSDGVRSRPGREWNRKSDPSDRHGMPHNTSRNLWCVSLSRTRSKGINILLGYDWLTFLCIGLCVGSLRTLWVGPTVLVGVLRGRWRFRCRF